jgi:excisionase family DNA binding protein
MSEKQEWMTVKEAAKYLKVSQMTIFRWTKSGKLPHQKMGNSIRITLDDLNNLGQDTDTSPEAKKDKERCLFCGEGELAEGHLQSTGKVYFKPLKTRFWSFSESLVPTTVRMCTHCGYCHTFADQQHWEKVR